MLPMREFMGPLLEAIRTKNVELAEEWSRSEQWATVEQLIAASSPPSPRYLRWYFDVVITLLTNRDVSFFSSIRSGSVAAGGVSVGVGASPSGPKWTCSFCTYLNRMELAECEMCSSPRLMEIWGNKRTVQSLKFIVIFIRTAPFFAENLERARDDLIDIFL